MLRNETAYHTFKAKDAVRRLGSLFSTRFSSPARPQPPPGTPCPSARPSLALRSHEPSRATSTPSKTLQQQSTARRHGDPLSLPRSLHARSSPATTHGARQQAHTHRPRSAGLQAGRWGRAAAIYPAPRPCHTLPLLGARVPAPHSPGPAAPSFPHHHAPRPAPRWLLSTVNTQPAPARALLTATLPALLPKRVRPRCRPPRQRGGGGRRERRGLRGAGPAAAAHQPPPLGPPGTTTAPQESGRGELRSGATV